MIRPIQSVIIVILSALLLSTPALAAKFYRWTDDNGVTHYTQNPPAENVQSKEVRILGPSSDQEAEVEQLQQQRQQAEAARQKQTKQQAEELKVKEAPDQATQERCEQHRKNLDELRNRAVVRSTDPDSGEVITLDAEARQKMIDETLEALKLCD